MTGHLFDDTLSFLKACIMKNQFAAQYIFLFHFMKAGMCVDPIPHSLYMMIFMFYVCMYSLLTRPVVN